MVCAGAFDKNMRAKDVEAAQVWFCAIPLLIGCGHQAAVDTRTVTASVSFYLSAPLFWEGLSAPVGSSVYKFFSIIVVQNRSDLASLSPWSH